MLYAASDVILCMPMLYGLWIVVGSFLVWSIICFRLGYFAKLQLGFLYYVDKIVLGFRFVLNVFVFFCYGDVVCSVGAVVGELTTLAYASRADRKYKIVPTKANQNVQNESKSKNLFPGIHIQRVCFVRCTERCQWTEDNVFCGVWMSGCWSVCTKQCHRFTE